jgi:hypothetical protein
VSLLLLVGACSTTSQSGQAAPVPSQEPVAAPPDGLGTEGIAAWQRWQALELDDYRYRIAVGCECATVNSLVEVRDGTVVTVGGKPYPGNDETVGITGFDDLDPTIDALFTQLGKAIRGADNVDVTYDADTGVPTRINVDWIREGIDDEIGYSATPPQALSSS